MFLLPSHFFIYFLLDIINFSINFLASHQLIRLQYAVTSTQQLVSWVQGQIWRCNSKRTNKAIAFINPYEDMARISYYVIFASEISYIPPIYAISDILMTLFHLKMSLPKSQCKQQNQPGLAIAGGKFLNDFLEPNPMYFIIKIQFYPLIRTIIQHYSTSGIVR